MKPNNPLPPGVSAFDAGWFAETLRLREEREGPLEDREAVAAARAAGGGLAVRILHRAVLLGEREGLVESVAQWRLRARLVLALGAVLAVASGFGAALAVLGDGSHAVNVVWALGGLLGVHLLSLAMWIGGLWLGGRTAGGLLGRIWLRLASPGSGWAARRDLGEALLGLLGQARLGRWWLGAVTHGLWLLALGGALSGVLLALAVRGYGFVWETTILSADVFVRFVEVVGWLPAQVGFAVPDPATIRASGSGPLSADEARIAWSSWLIGCLAVYGVLPRLLLWALCFVRWRRGRVRLRPDTNRPGYAALRERLLPASERIGVTDPAPVCHPHLRSDHGHVAGEAAALLVGLELDAARPWPPSLPEGVRDGGVIDTREERQRLLEALRESAPRRLLVACDARLSPDRGSLQFIAELARHAGDCRVWLMGSGEESARPAHWREGLERVGFVPERVVAAERGALDWLATAHDDAPARGVRGRS